MIVCAMCSEVQYPTNITKFTRSVYLTHKNKPTSSWHVSIDAPGRKRYSKCFKTYEKACSKV